MPRLPVPSDTARAYPPALIQTAHGFENPRVWCILETRRRTSGFESRLLAPTQQGPLAERAFVAFVVLRSYASQCGRLVVPAAVPAIRLPPAPGCEGAVEDDQPILIGSDLTPLVLCSGGESDRSIADRR